MSVMTDKEINKLAIQFSDILIKKIEKNIQELLRIDEYQESIYGKQAGTNHRYYDMWFPKGPIC